jgi:glucoamylase
MPRLVYSNIRAALKTTTSSADIGNAMFTFMLQNVATSQRVLNGSKGRPSRPGCIIASPSYPAAFPGTDQDYVFHWTRDAAITIIEIAARRLSDTQMLEDYVTFSRLTQTTSPSDSGTEKQVDFACYRVDGTPRDKTDPDNPDEKPWHRQSDGPALRVIALLALWSQLSSASQTTARTIIKEDCAYLIANYGYNTQNLWEETDGKSFFARSVQLKCLQDLATQNGALSLGLDTLRLNAASADLKQLLAGHWQTDHYASILDAGSGEGWDLNSDVVMASVYGGIPRNDPKLLATAAKVRAFFQNEYPINQANLDQGPLIGRYPLDDYDGNTSDAVNNGQPWVPCTCVFAELYYRIANDVRTDRALTIDALAKAFFDQAGVDAKMAWSEAANALTAAGDRMLDAVVAHSDHLQLSEQYDRVTGYETSVRDLTWSYASYLSAVRAR